jgi:gluconate kinase
MEGNTKSKSRALLVFGAPCSGKTTFATKFAKKFGLAYYNFNDIAIKGAFSRPNVLLVLEQIAKTKATIVIEGGIATEKKRDEFREVLKNAGYDVSLIWIQTDVNTLRARMKKRYKSVSEAKNAFDDAVAKLEAPSEDENPIILSGKHTFETQTKHVLAGLADVN